ncbi:MAG: ribbon-helix-helix protein, CopG family [Candidatus Diapherotrites archaeon]|nr:ribbon-helix-helix protein, CopG family [Candidatus Diapherotrites archaeon]
MAKTAVLPPIKIGRQMLERLDELVEKGSYRSRSDAVRHAIAFIVRDYEASMKVREEAVQMVRKARKEIDEECLKEAGGDEEKAWEIFIKKYT